MNIYKLDIRGDIEMKLRKFLVAALASAVLTTPLLAQPINLNGKVEQVDSEIIQNTTVVAVRQLGDLLETNLNYNAKNKTVDVVKDNVHIKLDLSTSKISVNDATPVKVVCVVKNGRTYLPLRVIGEALGFKIGFHNGVVSVSDADYVSTNTNVQDEYHLMIEPYTITQLLHHYFLDVYESGIGQYSDLVDLAGSTWGALVAYRESVNLPAHLQKDIDSMELFCSEIEALGRGDQSALQRIVAICQDNESWLNQFYDHNCGNDNCDLYHVNSDKWTKVFIEWAPDHVNWTLSLDS